MKYTIALLALVALMIAFLPEAIAGSRTNGAPTMSAINFDVPAPVVQPTLTITPVTVAAARIAQRVEATLNDKVDGTDRTPTATGSGHARGFAQPTRAVPLTT